MQITLVQSEIEQALKNFINEQVNVKEGMEINITLKATRGDEGTTAIIDINKSADVVSPAPKELPMTKRVSKPEPEAKQAVADTSEQSAPESVEKAEANQEPKRPSLFSGLGNKVASAAE